MFCFVFLFFFHVLFISNQLYIFSVEQDCIFRTLSAILTLGNAEFVDVTDENGSECAVVVETYLIGRVAELLGIF